MTSYNDITKQGSYLPECAYTDEAVREDWLQNNAFDEVSKEIIHTHIDKITQAWEMQPAPLQDLAECEAILSFAFGFGQPFRAIPERQEGKYSPHFYTPGKSNEDMARVIQTLVSTLGQKPVFAQQEVSVSLEALSHHVGFKHTTTLDPDYLSTTGVVRQLAPVGLEEARKILIVAHPDHARRCVAATETILGNEALVPDLTSICYDEHSTQQWTQNEEAYRLHGVTSRCYAIKNRFMEVRHLERA